MTRNTNIYSSVLLVILSIFLSCGKASDENDSHEIVDSIALNSEQAETVNKNNGKKGEEWNFYSAYYQRANENDKPEIYEDEVVNKFKNVKVLLTVDTIWIDNNVSPYTIETVDSKQYYVRSYAYENYVEAFKNAYDIDIKNNVSCLRISYDKYLQTPFYDYFKEGGSTVFIDSSLFLTYKGYLVCYKKHANKVWDPKYCDLPFDLEKEDRLCQVDLRERYPDLCANEYPIFYFKNNKEFEEIVANETKRSNPSYYFNIKTNLDNINTIVAVYPAEVSDESYGDERYIINIKDNKVMSSIKDENDLINYKYFIIKEDLSIVFYETNGLHPKEKILKTFQMNKDGSFSLVK